MAREITILVLVLTMYAEKKPERVVLTLAPWQAELIFHMIEHVNASPLSEGFIGRFYEELRTIFWGHGEPDGHIYIDDIAHRVAVRDGVISIREL